MTVMEMNSMVNIFFRKRTDLEDIYEILFKEHYSAVYRILYTKFNNHDICEEAAQEAFHIAFNKLNQLKDKNKWRKKNEYFSKIQ